jgi:hypothetical protein
MKNKILLYFLAPAMLLVILNSGCKYDQVVPEIIEPPAEVTFSGDLLPIFNDGCNVSGCHSPGAVAPDLSPNNAYDALINGGYINLDFPEESELYRWVNGEGSTTMPISGTDPEIVAIVLKWIQDGALNN